MKGTKANPKVGSSHSCPFVLNSFRICWWLKHSVNTVLICWISLPQNLRTAPQSKDQALTKGLYQHHTFALSFQNHFVRRSKDGAVVGRWLTGPVVSGMRPPLAWLSLRLRRRARSLYNCRHLNLNMRWPYEKGQRHFSTGIASQCLKIHPPFYPRIIRILIWRHVMRENDRTARQCSKVYMRLLGSEYVKTDWHTSYSIGCVAFEYRNVYRYRHSYWHVWKQSYQWKFQDVRGRLIGLAAGESWNWLVMSGNIAACFLFLFKVRLSQEGDGVGAEIPSVKVFMCYRFYFTFLAVLQVLIMQCLWVRLF